MTDPADPNPYAPPTEAEAPVKKGKRKRRAGTALDEARAALDEHLSDPEAVRHDAKEAGPRVRVATIVLSVLAVASLVGAAASPTNGPFFPLSIGAAIIFGLLGVMLLVFDLTLVPHAQPSPPEKALASFFKAIARARLGYAWARLTPTAREQRVETPELSIATVPGEFTLSSPRDLKAYLETCARPGKGQIRAVAAKRFTLIEVDDDVAVVEADLSFQSWPSWVSGVMAVSFVLFRPLILVGIILYFAMRKKDDLRIRKTLLRGRDGAWYVLDADLTEGASR